jgi:hypothetical protein
MNSSLKAVRDGFLITGGILSAVIIILISIGLANGAGADMASGMGMALYFLIALFVGLPSGVVAFAKAIGYLLPADRNLAKAVLMLVVALVCLGGVGLMLWQMQVKYHPW